MPELPRDIALRIVQRLVNAGHVAYFAGGCVRDELLGLPPKDYDVATDATPDRIGSLFRRTREVGKVFGVMLVREGDTTVEVTTFRREGAYTDRRRPDSIEFADAPSDARRRDFTINALFIDPLAHADASGPCLPGARGRVIDYVGGLDDLNRRVIRAVGDPDARLNEDDLRALRAVRFAARLGFEIDPQTEAAIRRHAGDLRGISRERIGEEIRMMLTHPARARAVLLLERLGLDAPVLNEAPIVNASSSVPRRPLVAALEPQSGFVLAVAAWMLDRAAAQDPRADDAEAIEAHAGTWVRAWRSALCMTNRDRDDLLATVQGVGTIENRWSAMAVASRKRAAAAAWFAAALRLTRVRQPTLAQAIDADVAQLAATAGGIAPQPWVSGDDLIAVGVQPGPMFGKWLDAIYDAQLEGRLSGPEDALRMGLALSGVQP